MKESRKFYYLDKDGNKKKYVGKVIFDNGSYNGILTSSVKEEVKKNLTYHPEVEEVKGYAAYYTYKDANGEDAIFLDVVKRDDNGNLYFTYTEKIMFNLNYHPQIDPKEEYYTYVDKEGNECRYAGKVFYNKSSNTYQGELEK